MLQNVSEKPFAAQDADPPLLHTFKKPQLLPQETVFFQNTPAMLQDQLASFCQSHAACVSFKQGQTDLALCFGNLTAHDRRRNVHMLGGTSNRPDPNNRHEHSQFFRIERFHGTMLLDWCPGSREDENKAVQPSA
ncbi:hypothetical protein FHW02_004229 [Ochrobactrum sp. RH1CCR137]|nr:hypothetical protein [Ochrobactrum sp. RH1CCR137]MBA8858004.1 hypothetical protein [Ochrobactrum sp. RH1CCR134]